MSASAARSTRRQASGRPALVPFITAGYPQRDDFIATLKAVAGGRRCRRTRHSVFRPDGRRHDDSALEFRGAATGREPASGYSTNSMRRAAQIEAPLVMMSYLNPLLAFGYDAARRTRACDRRVRLHRAGPAVRGKRGSARGARCQRRRSHSAGHTGNTGETTADAVRCIAGFRLCRDDNRHNRRRCRLADGPRRLPRHRRALSHRCRYAPASVFARRRTSPPSANMLPARSSARRWSRCSNAATTRPPGLRSLIGQ